MEHLIQNFCIFFPKIIFLISNTVINNIRFSSYWCEVVIGNCAILSSCGLSEWKYLSILGTLFHPSHQYEENLILLMTVFEIKKIILGKNMQKFWMRCSMKNYERGNNDIRKRHPTLFKDKKDHYYSFRPSDELVQTLPFEFMDNLKGGAYIKLLSKWMTNIRSKLTQSQRNLITSIQLVRSYIAIQ